MNINEIEVGQRVKFIGNSVIGECVGIVETLYPPDKWDDPDYPGSVEMRPDPLPKMWPYKGCETFAPWVNELQQT